MQRLLSPQFKTKYPGTGKAGISTGLMSFCMFSREPARTKQRACLGTRPGLLNTGFIVSSPMGLPDCGRVTGRGARGVCLPEVYTSYGKSSGALPGTWDTAKISGTGFYCRTILLRSTPLRSVYGNARGCSPGLGLVSRDRARRLAKPTLNCRKPL